MALINKKLSENFETLFMPTSTEYMFLSSSLVKEIARYDGSLDGLVPDDLIDIIKERCTLQ